jgi:hypothetical protein
MKPALADIRGSWHLDETVVVDPGASWSVVFTAEHPQAEVVTDPDAVDAAGPDAALGRANDARPQVLGNRFAISTAPTAQRPASPFTKKTRSHACHRASVTRYWRPAIRSGRI